MVSSFRDSFIHSFWPFLKRLFKSTTTQRHSRHSTDTVSEFHAEVPPATVSEGLAQGPYVAARARFEPATVGKKGKNSTNEPPRPNRWVGKVNNNVINIYTHASLLACVRSFYQQFL